MLVLITLASMLTLVVGLIGFRSAPSQTVAAPPAPTPKPSPVKTPTAAPTTPTQTTRPAPSKPIQTTRQEPARLVVPTKGPQKYTRAKLSKKSTATQGTVLRYSVLVEKGMPFDAKTSAAFMQKVLDDKRSWRGTRRWRFELVDSAAEADLTAYIASEKTTDKLCAPLLTRGEVSCQNGDKVVLNATRWGFGAKTYGKSVVDYRRYLVNHEFGHALGKQHVGCPGKGERAPVMLQQTKGLRGCKANPWPAPNRT